ncbi:MAG TPA: CDP-alcohol phosphatidyltransferase family protein [Gemmatimonadaceae bacterium]|nr:CDP-alcohol phosphatidyltransferase family protein [Gemmatimonadaceae bacterium]
MLSRLLRQNVASWAIPIAARLPFSPNALTVAGVAFAAGGAALFAVGAFQLASLALFMSGTADVLDGATARLRGTGHSVRGAFVDSAADRVSDNLIYGGMLFYYVSLPTGSPVAVIAIFVAASASNIASYIKTRSESVGIPCNAGFFKRQERFAVIMTAALFGPDLFVWALVVLAVFALESMTTRLLYAYRRMTP